MVYKNGLLDMVSSFIHEVCDRFSLWGILSRYFGPKTGFYHNVKSTQTERNPIFARFFRSAAMQRQKQSSIFIVLKRFFFLFFEGAVGLGGAYRFAAF